MSAACEKCGAFGEMPHSWVEGDCILPHKKHSKATIGHVCEPCVEKHRTWLTEITELYATLYEVIPAGSIPDDTADHKRPKKRPASPAPFRLDAWAMLHNDNLYTFTLDEHGVGHPAYLDGSLPDVPAVLAGWASCALDYGATNMCTTSAVQLDGAAEHIAAQPWVDEYDAELRWLRQSLRRAHGITDPQHLGKCLTVTGGKDCGGSVWPDRTGGKPKCDRCGRRYKTLDLVRLKAMEGTG